MGYECCGNAEPRVGERSLAVRQLDFQLAIAMQKKVYSDRHKGHDEDFYAYGWL
jgi:hypothetical protein